MPVRGTGRVSAAERCGSFEIIVNPSATSTQGGGRVPRRIVVVNLTSLITKDQKTVCELIYSFNARGTGRASVCVVVVVVGKEGEREPAGTVYLAKKSLIMIY